MSGEHPRGTKHRATLLYLIGALGVLFVLLAVMASREVWPWEQDSLRIVYGASEDLRTIALVITQLGSVWFWLALVALLFIVRRRPGAALAMIRNGVLVYAAVAFVKFVVARPRPEVLLHDVVPREVTTIGLGFPSAHVAIATVMALTLLPYFKGPWRWIVPIVWISLVAWSRLYLGVHAPLDIIGGLVLGFIVILTVKFLPAKGMWKQENMAKS